MHLSVDMICNEGCAICTIHVMPTWVKMASEVANAPEDRHVGIPVSYAVSIC